MAGQRAAEGIAQRGVALVGAVPGQHRAAGSQCCGQRAPPFAEQVVAAHGRRAEHAFAAVGAGQVGADEGVQLADAGVRLLFLVARQLGTDVAPMPRRRAGQIALRRLHQPQQGLRLARGRFQPRLLGVQIVFQRLWIAAGERLGGRIGRALPPVEAAVARLVEAARHQVALQPAQSGVGLAGQHRRQFLVLGVGVQAGQHFQQSGQRLLRLRQAVIGFRLVAAGRQAGAGCGQQAVGQPLAGMAPQLGLEWQRERGDFLVQIIARLGGLRQRQVQTLDIPQRAQPVAGQRFRRRRLGHETSGASA
ncbi:conserved hypothetical protein, partial [Ricinus communis]